VAGLASGSAGATPPGLAGTAAAGVASAAGTAFDAGTSGTTITSPALTVSGFGSFPQIPPGSAIAAVVANITWFGSDAAIGAPSYQLWDGTHAQIGTTQRGIASVSPHADSVVFTGAVYAQLATLQLQVYASSQNGNSGATASFDAVSLSVQWIQSVSQSAFPASLAVIPALPAVTVELDTAVTPGTLAVASAFPAQSAGLLNAAVTPAVLAARITLPAPAAAAGTTAPAGTLAVATAFPAQSAGLLNAAVAPAVLAAPVTLPAPAAAAGTGASPGTLAVTTAFPASSAGLLNAAVTPAVLAVVPAFPAPAVSVTGSATVTPAVLAVVPAFPAITDITAPGWASAAAAGASWTNPADAEGTPDGSYAFWTVP
jgi:hypothetical protein